MRGSLEIECWLLVVVVVVSPCCEKRSREVAGDFAGGGGGISFVENASFSFHVLQPVCVYIPICDPIALVHERRIVCVFQKSILGWLFFFSWTRCLFITDGAKRGIILVYVNL